MSLHCSCRLPHSNPSYPQQMPSLADYCGPTPPLPLFKPPLPMGTIHRHLKRKLSSISNEAGQKEEPRTRPMRDVKRPRRCGPDGRVVQAGAAQPIAILLPPKPGPVHFGGPRLTAATSTWRIGPSSRDNESSESDTSDDEDETATAHTTRNASPEQPSTAYQYANHFLNSLHKARALRPSSVPLSSPTPNAGTARTPPGRNSINYSPLSPLHLKKPIATLRHLSQQENPDEQAEKDLVTKQYEETNRALGMLMLSRHPPPSAPRTDSSSEEEDEDNE